MKQLTWSLFSLILLSFSAYLLQAQPVTDVQGDVVIGGAIPDPSAILDVQSDSEGSVGTSHDNC